MQEHMHDMHHEAKEDIGRYQEGYEHHEMMMKDFKKRTIISGIFTLLVIFLSPTIQQRLNISIPDFGLNTILLMVFASIIVLYGAYPFFKGAISSLKRGLLDMNVLVSLAVTAGYLYSVSSTLIFSAMDFYREISTLVLFLVFGHRIEMRAVMSASNALNELVKLLPLQANLIKGKEIISIPTAEVVIGDILLIRPGEKIPTDGKIIEGMTSVNESMITGESAPISKKIGDKVIGGTINITDTIQIVIEKIGKDTALAQIITLVKNAQQSKPRTQKLADRAAQYLTIIAIVASMGALIYRYYFTAQNFVFALTVAITVLVIACPHALGLAIPTVTSITTTIAAKNGILIKDMETLELAKNLDYMIFDKTGTLTKGTFEISDIIIFDDRDEDEILRKTAALEINSEHVIAKGIVQKAKEKKLEILESKSFKSFAGTGVQGIVDGEEISIGNETLMMSLDIMDPQAKEIGKTLSMQGKTIVYVATEKKMKGIIALSDIIREESFEAVKALKGMGIKVAMLTGDNKTTAQYVAEKLSLDKYFSEILPGNKSAQIRELQTQGYRVAMVGDGVNDAPALVQSDIGIAIGTGTDVAGAAAGIILVQNNPKDIIKLIKLSKITRRKMIQNLRWAAGYNVIVIPLATGILSGYNITLKPEYAALIMAASSIIVVMNALLLKKSRLG